MFQVLKKELDNLKDGVLRAEVVARAAQKKYEDESKKLKELISQFEAANDIRQAAYHHLQSLKRELFEKVCSRMTIFSSFPCVLRPFKILVLTQPKNCRCSAL